VIAHVVAKIKGVPYEELAEAVWENSSDLLWGSSPA
jgi:Tat protein secretion system quality control protein TatD with DNase activity